MRQSNRRKRNYIIAGLCMILLIMVVGYAAFSSQLKISGTSSISSSWNIQITNIETILPSESGGSGIPDGYNISEPTYTPTSATFSAGFELPGSMIGYIVEISNLGKIDGLITIGNLSCGDNYYIECTVDAFDKNPLKDKPTNSMYFDEGHQNYSDIEFILRQGEKHYIFVMVGYADVTEQPTDLDTNIKLDLTYEQYKDTSIPVPSGETTIMGGQEIELVSAGDGLYKDTYESGRYIYRGNNPNNYIMFNDELWRIVAKETDGTYKVIRNELLPQTNPNNMQYDEHGNRSKTNNTYCDFTNSWDGCGVFAAVSGIYRTPDGKHSGTVTENSSIQKYLNGEYYNNLSSTSKNQLISHSFNIGAVAYLNQSGNDSIEKNIAGEKMFTWTGNIGLINVSDLLKASTKNNCTSATDAEVSFNEEINVCSSYLISKALVPNDDDAYCEWTINATAKEKEHYSNYVWTSGYSTNNRGCNYISLGSSSSGFCSARPVVYLNSLIDFSGTGTQSDPYVIES